MSEIRQALQGGIDASAASMRHSRSLGKAAIMTEEQVRKAHVVRVRDEILAKKKSGSLNASQPRDMNGRWIDVGGFAEVKLDDGTTVHGKITSVPKTKGGKVTVEAGGKKFKVKGEDLAMTKGGDGGEPSVNADLPSLSDSDLPKEMKAAEESHGQAASPRGGGRNDEGVQAAQDRMDAIHAEAQKRGVPLEEDGSDKQGGSDFTDSQGNAVKPGDNVKVIMEDTDPYGGDLKDDEQLPTMPDTGTFVQDNGDGTATVDTTSEGEVDVPKENITLSSSDGDGGDNPTMSDTERMMANPSDAIAADPKPPDAPKSDVAASPPKSYDIPGPTANPPDPSTVDDQELESWITTLQDNAAGNPSPEGDRALKDYQDEQDRRKRASIVKSIAAVAADAIPLALTKTRSVGSVRTTTPKKPRAAKPKQPKKPKQRKPKLPGSTANHADAGLHREGTKGNAYTDASGRKYHRIGVGSKSRFAEGTAPKPKGSTKKPTRRGSKQDGSGGGGTKNNVSPELAGALGAKGGKPKKKQPKKPSGGYDASKHPHAGTGPGGGQFITAGGSKGGSKKEKETAAKKMGFKDGKLTTHRIRSYQKKKGLVADGKIGHATVAALRGKKAAAGKLSEHDRAFLAGGKKPKK